MDTEKDKKIEEMIGKMGNIAEAFDIPLEEFSQRALTSNILSTNYAVLKSAAENSKIIYRRGINMKIGLAITQAYEVFGGENIPFDKFYDYVTRVFLRLDAVPAISYKEKRLYARQTISQRLKTFKDLGLVSTGTGSHSVKEISINPKISKATTAVLINPETMLRNPHIKAMAQTIGSMIKVDKEQGQLNVGEVSDYVQDSLISNRILENRKSKVKFENQSIEPFSITNEVPFYSKNEDSNLLVLPTNELQVNDIRLMRFLDGMDKERGRKLLRKSIISEGSLYSLVGDNYHLLTNGENPLFIPMVYGRNKLFFNRIEPVINSLSDFFGVGLSRFIPSKNESINVYAILEKRLFDEIEGPVISQALSDLLSDGLEEPSGNDKKSSNIREIIAALHFDAGLIEKDNKRNKVWVANENSRKIISDSRSLVNLTGLGIKHIAEILGR